MYRIATAPKTIYPNQYAMRKQFEEALVAQAKFLVDNGDSAEISTFRLTPDKPHPNKDFPQEVFRDESDMSPDCARNLETLGLLRWFRIGQFVRIDMNLF
jgi:hypothetical protein